MRMNRRHFLMTAAGATAALALPVPAFARQGRFTPIRRGVGTFEERGGTIGFLVTDDAFVVVDTQFPDTAGTCLAGLRERTDRRIDLLINTHHHGDHTAGNGIFRPRAERHLAHRNVPGLQRRAAEARGNTGDQVFADLTFDDTHTVDVGDETVTLRHFGPAHTGGDAIIHFEKADVAHMGDLVFHYRPPFIDVPGGASTRHWITVLERAHAAFSDDTVFIFGHANVPRYGITGTRADLLVMRDFLGALVDFVQQGIDAGYSVEALEKTEVLPGFPRHVISGRESAIPRNIRTVYGELTAG